MKEKCAKSGPKETVQSVSSSVGGIVHAKCPGQLPRNESTFSLGDFDVTPITYRNLLFESRRTGKPPICIGPVLIHRKTYDTYLFFASTLIGMDRSLDRVQAFGTDGERALGDAFCHEFNKSVHLLCSIHFRRNIKQKLIEMNLITVNCLCMFVEASMLTFVMKD